MPVACLMTMPAPTQSCFSVRFTIWRRGKTGWRACARPAVCSGREVCSGAQPSVTSPRCSIRYPADFLTIRLSRPSWLAIWKTASTAIPRTTRFTSPTHSFIGRVNCRDLLAAGFQVLEVVAIEGPGWLARDFGRLWNDPVQRERLLDAVRKVEREPSVLGASSHIMAIGRK